MNTLSRLSPLSLYGTTLRVYDNGGRSMDRYTIIPPRNAGADWRERDGSWQAIAASESPYNPQGFGQHTSAMPGPHLGRRIRWDALPDDVQRFACEAFPAFAFDLDTMARHFCIAAIWADSPEGARPRATREAFATARKYAERFVTAFPALTLAALRAPGYGSHPDAGSPEAAFGHDLYLTAAGHGVGFWDRSELDETGITPSIGERLSRPLRDDFRRWYIEADFFRGWLYLSVNKEFQS
jgi:hypothetical protein